MTELENPNLFSPGCFNPYPEDSFGNNVFAKPGQLGIESNRTTCRRVAARLGRTATCMANGLILPGNMFFVSGSAKPDLVRGLAGRFIRRRNPEPRIDSQPIRRRLRGAAIQP